MTLWPTMSPLEILSVVVNLIGGICALLMYGKTYTRAWAVQNMPDYRGRSDPRMLAADRHFRCETGRIAFHLFSVLLSFWGFWYAESGTTYGYTAMLVRIMLGVMFCWFSVRDIQGDDKLESLLGQQSSIIVASLEARELIHEVNNDVAIWVGRVSIAADGSERELRETTTGELQRVLNIADKIGRIQVLVQSQSASVVPTREGGK